MYYILYLSSLCRRRRWSDPHYECQYLPSGISCTVRVNNREYQSEGMVESEVLAREAAAMRAYLLCRNFSVTDGAHPGTNALGSGNGTSPPSQQAASSLAGSLTPPHRGYPVPGAVNTYIAGSLSGQGNLPMNNGSSGRMVTSQGVVIVGHPQVGT